MKNFKIGAIVTYDAPAEPYLKGIYEICEIWGEEYLCKPLDKEMLLKNKGYFHDGNGCSDTPYKTREYRWLWFSYLKLNRAEKLKRILEK